MQSLLRRPGTPADLARAMRAHLGAPGFDRERHRVADPLRHYRAIAAEGVFKPLVGERVRHLVTGREGRIRPEPRVNDGFVIVRFDGEPYAHACDPADLAYLDPHAARRARLAWRSIGL